MKTFIYCSVFVLLTLVSLPVTADAFSRRTHTSEVTPTQAVTVPLKTETQDISAQAVPEPPVLLLMGIGIGLFALYSLTKRFYGQGASRE